MLKVDKNALKKGEFNVYSTAAVKKKRQSCDNMISLETITMRAPPLTNEEEEIAAMIGIKKKNIYM